MTRVNLFPHQRAAELQKCRWLQVEILANVGIVLLVLAVCVVATLLFDQAINRVSRDIQTQHIRLASLASRVKEVKQLETHHKHLQDYQRVLNHLSLSQEVPILLLDYVSQSVDPLTLWLVQLQVDGQSVHLDGVAFSRHEVVRFAERLEDTAFFQSIQIVETRAERHSNGLVYSFTMTLRLKEGLHGAPTPL